MSKMIQSWWFTQQDCKLIGIVVVEIATGEHKFYIGTGFGKSQSEDEEYIKKFGAPFYPEIFKGVDNGSREQR